MIDPIRPSPCTIGRIHGIQVSQVLIAVHIVLMTSTIGSRIFLGNFIAKSSGGFGDVGIYYLALFIAQTGVYVLTARRCKEHSFLPFFRASFLLHMIFYYVLYRLQSEMVNYLVPLALCHGIAGGLYWLPFTQYLVDFNKPRRRARFFFYMSLVGQGCGIVIPISFGWMITTYHSYAPVFLTLSALFGVGFLISLGALKPNPGPRATFSLTAIVSAARQHVDVRHALFAVFLIGLTLWGAMEQLTPLLVFHAAGSEFKLGMIASLLPLLEIASSASAGHLNQRYHGRMAIVCSSIIFLGILNFVDAPALPTIILYACAVSLGAPALSIIMNTLGINVLHNHADLHLRQTEYLVLRELCLGSSRVISYGALFLVSYLSADTLPLRVLLVSLGVAVLACGLYLQRIEIREEKETL